MIWARGASKWLATDDLSELFVCREGGGDAGGGGSGGIGGGDATAGDFGQGYDTGFGAGYGGYDTGSMGSSYGGGLGTGGLGSSGGDDPGGLGSVSSWGTTGVAQDYDLAAYAGTGFGPGSIGFGLSAEDFESLGLDPAMAAFASMTSMQGAPTLEMSFSNPIELPEITVEANPVGGPSTEATGTSMDFAPGSDLSGWGGAGAGNMGAAVGGFGGFDGGAGDFGGTFGISGTSGGFFGGPENVVGAPTALGRPPTNPLPIFDPIAAILASNIDMTPSAIGATTSFTGPGGTATQGITKSGQTTPVVGPVEVPVAGTGFTGLGPLGSNNPGAIVGRSELLGGPVDPSQFQGTSLAALSLPPETLGLQFQDRFGAIRGDPNTFAGTPDPTATPEPVGLTPSSLPGLGFPPGVNPSNVAPGTTFGAVQGGVVGGPTGVDPNSLASNFNFGLNFSAPNQSLIEAVLGRTSTPAPSPAPFNLASLSNPALMGPRAAFTGPPGAVRGTNPAPFSLTDLTSPNPMGPRTAFSTPSPFIAPSPGPMGVSPRGQPGFTLADLTSTNPMGTPSPFVGPRIAAMPQHQAPIEPIEPTPAPTPLRVTVPVRIPVQGPRIGATPRVDFPTVVPFGSPTSEPFDGYVPTMRRRLANLIPGGY